MIGKNSEGVYELSGGHLYFFLVILIVVFSVFFIFSLNEEHGKGFQEGYVCAFEHERIKQSIFVEYDYSPSFYCGEFSRVFDEFYYDGGDLNKTKTYN